MDGKGTLLSLLPVCRDPQQFSGWAIGAECRLLPGLGRYIVEKGSLL